MALVLAPAATSSLSLYPAEGLSKIHPTRSEKILNTIANIFTFYIHQLIQNYRFTKALERGDLSTATKALHAGADASLNWTKICVLPHRSVEFYFSQFGGRAETIHAFKAARDWREKGFDPYFAQFLPLCKAPQSYLYRVEESQYDPNNNGRPYSNDAVYYRESKLASLDEFEQQYRKSWVPSGWDLESLTFSRAYIDVAE